MRKLLLCLLAITIGFAGFAQNKPVFKSDFKSYSAIKADRIGQEAVKTKPITTSTVTTPANYKNTGDVNFVTVVSIGTSANAYSYGYAGGQKAIVCANNDINTVTHFHRQGGTLDPGGYSGDLSYDVSFDGGLTWTNQIECYKATNNAGGTYYTDAARYPNHGIWNPEGNTDPANAYLTFYAPCIDGSNGADSWGGYAHGRARFGDQGDTTKNLTHSAPPFYQYIADAYDVSKDGIIIAVDANQDWTTGTLAYLGSLIVYRGVWDEGEGDFIFERNLIDFPTNAENDRPVHVKFAFGPDGQTGWIAVITDNGSVTPLNEGFRYYYPVLIKTTDGGLTWENPVSVRLDGPEGLEGVKNYLTDAQIAEIFVEPLPTRDEIPYTTAFDCDVTVDAWGNPHIGVVVGIGASTEYSIIDYPYSRAAFDISSTDGGTKWVANSCGQINMFRGTYGTDYTEDNRIQVASTQDGSKVFVTWLDTQLEGATENNAPDIFARGIDVQYYPAYRCLTVLSAGEDLPVNVTTFSEAMWQSYFAITSRFVLDDNGTYTIPFSYEALTTPFDPTLPVQYKYIQDFSFTDVDWEDCYVGVVEPENNNISSVSQNYPNPFNGSTTISVDLAKSADLSLKVTDILGRVIMTVNKGAVDAGSYEFSIDGSNLESGVYFYTVTADKNSVTRKMSVR
jgi:hypothetical protein